MLRNWLSALGFVLVTSPAAAQTISTPPVAGHTGDTVVLKDGTTLHGTVGEMTPGQSLTIALPDGTTRTIEWGQIDKVDIDRAKQQPQVSFAQASGTMVHLDGAPSDAVVERLEGNGTEQMWTPACTGPCDRALPNGALYRLNGPGMVKSPVFRVEGASMRLEAHPSSSAARTGGLVMLIGGGVVFVNGISFIVVAATEQNYITQDSYNTFMIVGGVLTGVGAALAITGGVLFGSNMRTKVTGAATVRVPAWRDAPAQPSSRFAAVTFPALGGTF